MIYKETTASGETLIYMNGALLYKKYPSGDSVLFEKYGPPTRKADRDAGHY
ncbi:hypothetical protein [Pusillimonas noertemannii]|uniref:hypothetical protein n=1 Tax=Pusillimonas noertemannii TaxID=305977 RepID=UPI00333F2AAA